MDRRRRAELIDTARRFAQSAVERIEVIWAFEEVIDQEEIQLMQDELNKVAKRIGATRTLPASNKRLRP